VWKDVASVLPIMNHSLYNKNKLEEKSITDLFNHSFFQDTRNFRNENPKIQRKLPIFMLIFDEEWAVI
jgi:hypothetical protein